MNRAELSRDDLSFIEAFEAGTILPGDWSHRSHIRMAWIYLRVMPFDEALQTVRVGLRRFAQRHAIPDSLERGYHETLTVAWMRLMASGMTHHGGFADSSAFCEAMPHLLCRTLTRVFYSRDRIMTLDAKERFVPPDLAELPASCG